MGNLITCVSRTRGAPKDNLVSPARSPRIDECECLVPTGRTDLPKMVMDLPTGEARADPPRRRSESNGQSAGTANAFSTRKLLLSVKSMHAAPIRLLPPVAIMTFARHVVDEIKIA